MRDIKGTDKTANASPLALGAIDAYHSHFIHLMKYINISDNISIHSLFPYM